MKTWKVIKFANNSESQARISEQVLRSSPPTPRCLEPINVSSLGRGSLQMGLSQTSWGGWSQTHEHVQKRRQATRPQRQRRGDVATHSCPDTRRWRGQVRNSLQEPQEWPWLRTVELPQTVTSRTRRGQTCLVLSHQETAPRNVSVWNTMGTDKQGVTRRPHLPVSFWANHP